MKELRKLPKIDELYYDPLAVSKQNELNILLSTPPKNEWVKDHPMAQGVKYIPIEIIEYLLTQIFVKWRVEVKEVKLIANSVQTTIRLHVQDPISGDWDWQDGIGAAPIQTKKGAGATDFTQVLSDAVMKAAPASETYAVKDAAEKFGRIFGKDLNRKEVLPYQNLEGKIDFEKLTATQEQVQELRNLLYSATMHHDEKDEWYNKLTFGISIAEYQMYKIELADKNKRLIDRVRDGELLKEKELSKAIKQAE
jgi:hypothetical protein